jgi:hypothetical protein
MPPVASIYWFLVVGLLAICGVVSLAIAARLIRELGQTALERSAQEDVPQVLTALSGLLDKLSQLLPWSRRRLGNLPSGDLGSQTAVHTESVKDLPEGEPQAVHTESVKDLPEGNLGETGSYS